MLRVWCDMVSVCQYIPEEMSTAGQSTHAALRPHFPECPWPTRVPRDPWPVGAGRFNAQKVAEIYNVTDKSYSLTDSLIPSFLWKKSTEAPWKLYSSGILLLGALVHLQN